MGRWITKNGVHVWIEDEGLSSALRDRFPSKKYNEDVKYITKIKGKGPIEKEFGKLANDDIVLTDERKEHINERRKDDFDFIMDNMEETINDYDYLLKDDDKKVMFIKLIKEDKHYNNLAVILSLEDETRANSILTGMRIREKTLKSLLKSRKIIDKKE